MRNIKKFLSVLAVIIAVATLGFSSWSHPDTIVPMQQVTPTSTSAMPPSTPESWILLNLPTDASQLEIGAEIYRLVCKACHGDVGQGLTDAWRSTWAPADQNCWQSKCHAANHPPDGFTMPNVPALVGSVAMARFYTASDLHDFIATYMPWQNPGSLREDQAWQVTAYVLDLNNIDPGSDLKAETALQIKLGRQPSQNSKAAEGSPFNMAVLVIILSVVLVVLFLYRKFFYRR